MFRTGIIVLTVGIVAAGPAQAQRHQHGATADTDHGAHCMHASPDMHAAHAASASHHFAPGMLLMHAADLKLSAEQTSALESIKATHKQDCERRMAAAKAAESAAAAALAAESPDLARYEAGLLEAAKQKVDCKVDMARLTQQAKALLTDEQRQLHAQMNHAGHTGH